MCTPHDTHTHTHTRCTHMRAQHRLQPVSLQLPGSEGLAWHTKSLHPAAREAQRYHRTPSEKKEVSHRTEAPQGLPATAPTPGNSLEPTSRNRGLSPVPLARLEPLEHAAPPGLVVLASCKWGALELLSPPLASQRGWPYHLSLSGEIFLCPTVSVTLVSHTASVFSTMQCILRSLTATCLLSNPPLPQTAHTENGRAGETLEGKQEDIQKAGLAPAESRARPGYIVSQQKPP